MYIDITEVDVYRWGIVFHGTFKLECYRFGARIYLTHVGPTTASTRPLGEAFTSSIYLVLLESQHDIS